MLQKTMAPAGNPATAKEEEANTCRLIYAITTLYMIAFFVHITLLPYVAAELQVSNIHFGYLATFFSLAQLLGSLIGGQISDSFGPKFLLVLALAASEVCFIIAGLAKNFLWLFISRIPGIVLVVEQAAQGCLAAATTGDDRTSGFARIGASIGFGLIFGPMLGGIATGFVGFRAAMIAGSGGLSLAALVLAVTQLKLPDSKETKSATADKSPKTGVDFHVYFRILTQPWIASLVFTKFLNQLATMTLILNIPIYAAEVLGTSPGRLSALHTLSGISMFVTNAFGISQVRAYFPDSDLLKFNSAISAAGFSLLALFFTAFWQLYLVVPLLMVASTFIGTISDSLATTATAKDDHGSVLGLIQCLNNLVFVIAPTLGAYLLEYSGFTALAILSVSLQVASIGTFLATNTAGTGKAKRG